jgi:hypothetical protein
MSENMEKWRCLDGSDGLIRKPFIEITFQRGPVPDVGINGCRIEDVIEVVQEQLLDHQGRHLACEENATALLHLESAREALLLRRRRREHQGVINTAQPHVPSRPIVDGSSESTLKGILKSWMKEV